jgi:ankyrin repeat protein
MHPSVQFSQCAIHLQFKNACNSVKYSVFAHDFFSNFLHCLQIERKNFTCKAEIGFVQGRRPSPTQAISDQDQACSTRTKIDKNVSSGFESWLYWSRNIQHISSFQDRPSIFAFHESRWPNNNSLLEVEKKINEHQKGPNNNNSSDGDLKGDLLRNISTELTRYNSEKQASLVAGKCRKMNLALQVQQTRWQRLKEVSAVKGLISGLKATLTKLSNFKSQLKLEKNSNSSKRRPDGAAGSLPEEQDVQLAASFDLLVQEIKEYSFKIASRKHIIRVEPVDVKRMGLPSEPAARNQELLGSELPEETQPQHMRRFRPSEPEAYTQESLLKFFMYESVDTKPVGRDRHQKSLFKQFPDETQSADVKPVEQPSEQEVCDQESLVKRIVRHLEQYMCSLTDRIMADLDKELDETSGKFHPGAVGELPLHQCFLLDLEELGNRIIAKYFNSPQLISTPYTNDLDPWRQRDPTCQPRRTNEDTLDLDHTLHLDACVAWEDGLFTGETVLHIAIAKKNAQRVEFLLERGASLTSRAKGTFFQPEWLRPLSKRLTWLQKAFAWMVAMDLDNLRYATLTQERNPDSACYYGELPLSFAASVGSVQICRLLYLEHKRRRREGVDLDLMELSLPSDDLWESKTYRETVLNNNDFHDKLENSDWRFINAVDCFGNTAMHLAVLHGQKQVVDWLMQVEFGADSLEVVNCEGFTPLTLAARKGNVDMFDHILNQHMSKTLWQYGDVKKTETDLRQVMTPCFHFSVLRMLRDEISCGAGGHIPRESAMCSGDHSSARGPDLLPAQVLQRID